MSDFAELNYTLEGPVALIALNRPDALNAFSKTLRNECTGAFLKAEADPTALLGLRL